MQAMFCGRLKSRFLTIKIHTVKHVLRGVVGLEPRFFLRVRLKLVNLSVALLSVSCGKYM